MTYASTTTVTVEKSRMEIEQILRRYGADQFVSGWDQERAVIGFQAQGRQVRFVLPMPRRDDPSFTTYKRSEYGSVLKRTTVEAEKRWEQACRQRWRALALVVKAKLEAVEADISTFETEFLGHIVLPNGQSVAEWMGPQIEASYASGSMPSMLPALGPGDAP